MRPYYEHAGITIYHGDCREILPQLGRFDLLLTDPPYGIRRDGMRASTSKHGGRKAYEFDGWDNAPPDAEAFRAMFAASSAQIIWGGNYFAEHLPPSMGWLVWDKGQRIAQSDGELAFTSYQRALRIYELNRVALMLDGAQHPTQKPLRLIRWCLMQAGDVSSVLDPYCGSGTTLVAAKEMGIRAVGIELLEKNCEISAKRLGQEVMAFA